MKKSLFFFILFSLNSWYSNSQNQQIDIVTDLNTNNHTLNIDQKIVFHNYSKDTIKEIPFHNWMNSYKNKETPLSKRLIEEYNKSLYFAKDKERGFTKINYIKNYSNNIELMFDDKSSSDIVTVKLNKRLLPNDSIILYAKYVIKIPKDTFTKYGYNINGYNLRYWYLIPAVYSNGWQTMSNLNMDDLYCYPTNYNIKFTIPKSYNLESNLSINKMSFNNNKHIFSLKGDEITNVEILINKKTSFKEFNIKHLTLSTNLTTKNTDKQITTTITERQIEFIEDYLGKYPHNKILLNKAIYDKNPVYGLNQLPSILNPFNDLFKFDIQQFKTLTNVFVNNTLLSNRRKDYWVNDGIQTYLMIKYVEKYYPEKKALGAISRIWGVRSYELAKLNFNDKYAFVHQFAMRKNLDQSLNKKANALSTFNRKIVSKYKAGLGLVYLDDYLGKNTVNKTLNAYYQENLLLPNKNKSFKQLISLNTSKNLDWFFNDYLQTNKKIDYTIKKVKQKGDSLIIGIKNESDFTAPISIYGIKNKEIVFKKWITDISNFKNITIPKGDFNRISLNYEAKYPEINLNNNWKNIKPSLFNKPLQFRFIKDIDNPHYNQIFYNVEYDYNYYDGIILGVKLSNKTLFKKKWIYKIKPTFGFKSNQINGSFTGIYTLYPKNSKLYKFSSGVVYSSYNYAPELSYKRLSPFVVINLKRKNLRDIGGKYLSARYLVINKEISKDSLTNESDNYSVFNARYSFSKPNIINNIKYNFDFQLAKKFSKLAFELEYRKLQKNNTQIDTRLFIGSFLFNNTSSNFFNYSLNRPSDYLFDYNYFGRSEDTGFLSQQIIISEGGFKSFFENNSANQWMITSNNSIGYINLRISTLNLNMIQDSD